MILFVERKELFLSNQIVLSNKKIMKLISGEYSKKHAILCLFRSLFKVFSFKIDVFCAILTRHYTNLLCPKHINGYKCSH